MEIQAIIMIVTPGGGLLAKPSSQIGLDRLFRSNRARGSACKSYSPPPKVSTYQGANQELTS